ncbi:DUF6705 family protein [Flavobacterium sp.]|uniref:DUF6705 family protein n=1 Tax=Flavobacterium sp. TaxID=239 RepID=UPI003752A4B3
MKKIIISFLFLLLLSTVKAQTLIIPIESKTERGIPGAYYKDTYNNLNQFVGIWKYENTTTNTILEIHLFKKTMNYNNIYYEDTLYGEYVYIENGVTKINTLPNLSTILENVNKHKVHDGNFFLVNENSPKCNDCYLGQKRVQLILIDPVKKVGHIITLRVNNTNPLTMRLHNTSDGLTYPSDANINTIEGLLSGVKVGVTIPLGWYDLVKQP